MYSVHKYTHITGRVGIHVYGRQGKSQVTDVDREPLNRLASDHLSATPFLSSAAEQASRVHRFWHWRWLRLWWYWKSCEVVIYNSYVSSQNDGPVTLSPSVVKPTLSAVVKMHVCLLVFRHVLCSNWPCSCYARRNLSLVEPSDAWRAAMHVKGHLNYWEEGEKEVEIKESDQS